MLIFLVLLSTTECLAYDAQVTNSAEDQAAMLILERANDVNKEFCESFKLNLSEETGSDAVVISHKPPALRFNASSCLQFNKYLQTFLARTPSKKLFIDFGSLII